MMQSTKRSLGLALLFAVACGGSSGAELTTGDDATVPNLGTDAGTAPGPGDSGDSEAVRLDGVYTVPVSEPFLRPFASQPVVLDWREANGIYRMDYDFPTDLTGVSQRVSFEGGLAREGAIELIGDLGSATCETNPSGTVFVCTERFFQMAFDLDRLRRDLERRGLSTHEIEGRLGVAALFESDPIGILEFTVE